MQSKIKVVNEAKTDIRLFKVKDKNVQLSNVLKDLKNFASKSFNLNCSFSFQYEDDDGDLITIDNGGDLKDAFESTKTTKLFVRSQNNVSLIL